MIVAIGGRSGVGTTTVTVNLAVALAQQGRRAVLVDVQMDRPRVAALCGIQENLGVSDILLAQRDIHEVLLPGPAGLLVVAGSPAASYGQRGSAVAHCRLIDQLRSLGRHAEFVVLDLGTGTRDVATRYWSAADQALIITTGDSDCVMDAYASVKLLSLGDSRRPQVYAVVNRATRDAEAIDVHRRIEQSCRRFLSLDVGAAGHVPLDHSLTDAAARGAPAIVQSPTSPAARAIDRIAATLVANASVAGLSPRGRSAA
jgi:flagellar biosynthesis protein FlhG